MTRTRPPRSRARTAERAGSGAPYDEMFAPDGTVRPAYEAVAALDGPVPRVIAAAEWETLERGVAQRVRALDAFLADLHGEGQVLRDGVIPRRLITSCARFHREAVGIAPPNGVRVHVAGIDVVRDETGTLRVLADNLRSPSGIRTVLENRRTTAFPDLLAANRVRPVDDYPIRLLRALRAAAPDVDDPRIVILGPADAEQTLLAERMGVRLVEGRELYCRDNVVYLKDDDRRVDVIYRRIDDDALDPLHFRPDSVLGVAGVLNAARAGNVALANAVGNGVADDKLVYTYVPDLVRYYLNEKPLLPNVATFRCWLPDELGHVLAQLDELVVKPVDGSGGIVFGPDASGRELAALRRKMRSDPRGWVAQPVVRLSTLPAMAGDRVVPCHVDLRMFAVNDGTEVFVLPGGLTRVAPEGSLVVAPGMSRDTWVPA